MEHTNYLGESMHYLLLLSLSLFSITSFAESLPDEPHVAVAGNASLEVKADQVIIQFKATYLNASGEVSKKEVDKKVAVLLENITVAGFSVDYVESVSQFTRPEYDYKKKKRKLLGVRVTHEMSYRLTDISKANQFVDILLTTKIDSISPLQYGLQTPDQWQAEVRKMAVLDSKQKAKDLALLYDVRLGKVYSINYQGNYSRPVQMRAMAMESDAVNIEPKNIIVRDSVQTVFILKP
jgi:uncharacterized protein YggE